MNAVIKSHIISSYKSNPLWGGLLCDLGSTFLEQNLDGLFMPATFDVSYVDGLVEGRTVAVSDLGCFSGEGEINACISLVGEAFFKVVITDGNKSAGDFVVANESGAQITVSVLSSDGSAIATGTGKVSFKDLATGDYFIRLQSETHCNVTLSFDADWMTGVDRFDYAGSRQNEQGANGNGSIDTATILDEGYHTGLLTCKDDTDFYRIGNIHTEQYMVVLNGSKEWTVAEYDKDGNWVQNGTFSNGIFTLTMKSMNYLLVEGTADMKEAEIDRYFLKITGMENGATDVVELDDLSGSKDEVSWESSVIVNQYQMELSMDGFEHVIPFVTTGTAIDLLNLPAGTYQWRVAANQEESEWFVGENIVSDNTNVEPKVFQSKADASDDMFFASPNGTWGESYYAKHTGTVGDWAGTKEIVSAGGKGRIQDLFFGSADPSTLYLTDLENGDALFLDDVYTGLPEEIRENTARLFRLQKIAAGAGDDIIDMTSQQFKYSGGDFLISGGDGDDIIWANRGRNRLFGDAGNDRIVGASSDDVIIGGIGDDAMHGGGSDIFTFCDNWGADTVEQLSAGLVTLWFASGDESHWDDATLTYTDGDNSVSVSGIVADKVTLKFGDDGSDLYRTLASGGSFAEFSSKRVFEEYAQGDLA